MRKRDRKASAKSQDAKEKSIASLVKQRPSHNDPALNEPNQGDVIPSKKKGRNLPRVLYPRDTIDEFLLAAYKNS